MEEKGKRNGETETKTENETLKMEKCGAVTLAPLISLKEENEFQVMFVFGLRSSGSC
jgi:hypothetical protein